MQATQEGFDLVFEDTKSVNKLKIWKKDTDTGTISGHHVFIPDITKAMWEAAIPKMTAIVSKLAPKVLKMEELPDIDGCEARYVTMNIPVPNICNRQIFTIAWSEWIADDEFQSVNTSEGIDDVIDAN